MFRVMQQQGKHCHTENHKRYERDRNPVQRYIKHPPLEREECVTPYQTFRVKQQQGKHYHAENHKRYERDRNPVQR